MTWCGLDSDVLDSNRCKPETADELSPPEPPKRPNVNDQGSFRRSGHRDVFRGVGARGTGQGTNHASQSAQNQCAERQFEHLQEAGLPTGGWVGPDQQGCQETKLSIKTHTIPGRTRTHVIRRLRARRTGPPTERATHCAEHQDV